MNQAGKVSKLTDLIVNSGEFGQLIDELDWSVTPMGSLTDWSPSLCTAVNLCLTSPIPMILFWGEEFIFIYNEPYRSLVKTTQYPRDFGQSAALWWGETWSDLHLQLQQVFQTGKTLQLQNQSLPIEGQNRLKNSFSLTLNPIWTETGAVGGILTTILAPTPEPEVEREQLLHQLQIERARLETIIQQMPAGVLVADAASGQLVLSNQQVREILGYADEPELNLGENEQNLEIEGFHLDGSRYEVDEWPLVRSLRTGEAIHREEILVQQFNDRLILISVNAAPIRDQQGEIIAAVAVFEDITEHKKVENALRVSEAKFKRLTDANIIGVIVADLKRIVEANDVFLEMVGCSREDLENGHLFWQKMTPPEYLKYDKTALQELILTGKCAPFEKEYFRKDGSRVPILLGATLLTESPLTWLCFVLDLTKLKQTEKALRSSEERLKLAFTAAKIGTFEWNIQTNTAYWTEEQEALYGLPPGGFRGDYAHWNELVHPGDRNRVKYQLLQAVNKAQDFQTEYRVIWPDGSLHWLAGKGRVFCDEQGKPLRMLGINEDITDRKQAEEALRDSEERFRLAAQAVAGVVYDWDLNTNNVYRSEGLYRLLGIRPEDVPQDRNWWSEQIHPEDLILCQTILKSVFNGEGDRYDFEYRVRHQQGHWVTIWDRGYLIRDKQGQLVRVVGSSADITLRKQAEMEREQRLNQERMAREQAETANRIKDEFLAVLSHELRSPLNPILGWAKLLRTGNKSPETINRALEIIERNAKLQAQLIEDLLDVSRILRGKLILNTVPINLEEIIVGVLESIKLAAEVKTIDIQTQIQPHIGQVLGDGGRLQQIVWNLVSNAVKFTPSGGRVEVWLEKVGTEAQIQVSDTGKGISAEFLPYVFEYFRQADSSTTRQFGGLGLGLAIVKYLTELHGGTVWAESAGEGQGSTFTVRLPLMLESAEIAIAPEASMAEIDLTGVRILAIDDEPDMRDLVLFILEAAGASVRVAASAKEGLLIFNEFLPDLLISDVGMPELDGYSLIGYIRSKSKEEGGEIPAIALTAYAGEMNQQKALSAGFQLHLCKPLEPEQLVKAIAKLLNRTKN